MERQYCASAFIIDFEKHTILLMYNKKLDKWLQPGGHIEGLETPIETAIRETYEETGIEIEIIGNVINGNPQPFAIERYINKVGDMIDIQFVAVPTSLNLSNNENNEVKWYSIDALDSVTEICDEIKEKAKYLIENFNK